MRTGRSRTARWLAAAVGLGVAAGTVLIARPAGASTTVTAQLALSGVVTGKSPVGGSVVGLHPGDKIDFKAAPAGLSTEGLNNLGIPVGDLLGSIVGNLAGYQVVLHLPAGFPGGKRDVKLGPCGGKPDLKVSFPDKGTFRFTWSARSVTVLPLLGCTTNKLKLDGNQLEQAGIALNAHNQYVGKVVVATDPPPGGISLQLPSLGAHPKVGGVQLPPADLPGATLPTLPVSPPSAGLGLPSSGHPNSPVPTSGSGGINYTPPGQSVEDKVMPKGYGGDGQHSPEDLNAVLLNGLSGGTGAVLGNSAGSGGGSSGSDGAPAAVPSNPDAKPAPTRAGRPVDLAANKAPAGQMPVLLAILAIIALSLVTATYARLYLMRRHVS